MRDRPTRTEPALRSRAGQTARDAAVLVVLVLLAVSVRVDLPGADLELPVSHAGVAPVEAPAELPDPPEAQAPAPALKPASGCDVDRARWVVVEIDEQTEAVRLSSKVTPPTCSGLFLDLSS